MPNLLSDTDELLSAINACNQEYGSPIEAPVVVIMGVESAGKTSLLEAMIGFPVGHKGVGATTRRPRRFQLRRRDGLQAPIVHFDGCKLDDHRELPDENRKIDEALQAANDFNCELLRISIESSEILLNMDLVDLIGLRLNAPKEEAEAIERIAASYIRKPTAVNVAVVKCTEDVMTVPDIKILDRLAVGDEFDGEGGKRRDFTESTLFIVNRITDTFKNFKNTSAATRFFDGFRGRAFHFVSLVPNQNLDPDPASYVKRCEFLAGLVGAEDEFFQEMKQGWQGKDQAQGLQSAWLAENDSMLGLRGAVEKVKERLGKEVLRQKPNLTKKIKAHMDDLQVRARDLEARRVLMPSRWVELQKIIVSYTNSFIGAVQNLQRGQPMESGANQGLAPIRDPGAPASAPSASALTFWKELDYVGKDKWAHLERILGVANGVFNLDVGLNVHGSCLRALKIMRLELLHGAEAIDSITRQQILAMAHDPNCGTPDVFPADKVVLDCASGRLLPSAQAALAWLCPFLLAVFTRHLDAVHDFLERDYPIVKLLPRLRGRLSDAYKQVVEERVGTVGENCLHVAGWVADSRQQGGLLAGALAMAATMGQDMPAHRAAVLNLAAQISYSGHVLDARGCECVGSFPGKYGSGWRRVVGGRHDMSVACVFLTSPDDGLGQCVPDPGRNDGKCYCHSIYGERDFLKFGYLLEVRPSATADELQRLIAIANATGAVVWNPKLTRRRDAQAEASKRWTSKGKVASWGCKWFHYWKANIEKARNHNQQIVVYYFEQQKGRGKVAWPQLQEPQIDLWDGVGLGGSQKCEVAYLDSMNIPYTERDVMDFVQRHDAEGAAAQHMSVHGSDRCRPLLDELQAVIARHAETTFVDVAQGAVYRVAPQFHENVSYEAIWSCAKFQYLSMVGNLLPTLEGIVTKELTTFMASTRSRMLEDAMLAVAMGLKHEDIIEQTADPVDADNQLSKVTAELRSLGQLLERMSGGMLHLAFGPWRLCKL